MFFDLGKLDAWSEHVFALTIMKPVTTHNGIAVRRALSGTIILSDWEFGNLLASGIPESQGRPPKTDAGAQRIKWADIPLAQSKAARLQTFAFQSKTTKDVHNFDNQAKQLW